MPQLDWQYPWILTLAVPALAWLLWAEARSVQPLVSGRRRALLMVRAVLVLLAVVALASPARVVRSAEQAVMLVVDQSQSLGEGGAATARALAETVRAELPARVPVGVVVAGAASTLLASPTVEREEPWNWTAGQVDGSRTDLSAAVALVEGLFPAGTARHVVIISDGQENRGDLAETARQAAASGLRLHAIALAGEARPDVRVTSLVPSQSQVAEGATVELAATVEGSLTGAGRVRLFENGLQVEERPISAVAGEAQVVKFSRSPEVRNSYSYRAVVDGLAGDVIPENNEALAMVDVRGKPLLLYVEGEPEEARYLAGAMEAMGLRLHVRTPETMSRSLRELNGYDAVILSDVPARSLGDDWMAALREYVGRLGGGLVMIGGRNSFGVGGYYRTPVEELLPVKLQAPDQEEQQSSALALVMDRSGSMSGPKIEFCKAAASTTAELLTSKDYLGVYAFDSAVTVVVPMSRVPASGGASLAGQIAGITAGGGTNIQPGMAQARADLAAVKAKIKHMIVLTDGQSEGTGYEAMAGAMRAEGITISTVAVGGDAAVPLLQAIAAAGGGQAYQTLDPASITRIFTQDTMIHTGRLIREEAFTPHLVEPHPLLRGWSPFESPALLGYVKTNRKALAQVPLVTDLGDPLLAIWRYDLGKVAAFTSDCKSRWAASWVTGWTGYSRFWAQVLRETARPPQGQNMDLALTATGGETIAEVRLLEDAGTFLNDAEVEADIFFAPAQSLSSALQPLGTRRMQQTGPGAYQMTFRPEQSGVYLVRARAGARVVSAGQVFNQSAEAATGQVNDRLLQSVARLTGGNFVAVGQPPILSLEATEVARHADLWPWLLAAFVPLALLDLLIRRWEHVGGMLAPLRRMGVSGVLKPESR
ncbi:MAG: VWA domain-containing protein [Verrucomicrobiales bacterium]